MTDFSEQEIEAGRAAFEAYTEDMGGQTYDDKPIPPWDQLGEKVQSGWAAAAKKVAEMRVDYGPQRWHGDPPEVGRQS